MGSMGFFFFYFAQAVELVTLFETVLNGGLPLILMFAIYFIFTGYKREKEAHIKALEDAATLRKEFTKKIEELFRERLESETENARIIQRATEALDSVSATLDRTNETLDSLTE